MSERAWQNQVESLAKLYGWRFFHAPDNRPVKAGSGRTYVQRVQAGFPDLVLVRGRRLVFVELKTDSGRVQPEQKQWMAALAETDTEVGVWRPRDLTKILRALGPQNEHASLGRSGCR